MLSLDFSGWTVFVHAEADDALVTQICAGLEARKARIPWEEPGHLPVERMAREALDTPQCVPLHPAAPKRGLIFAASIPLGLLLGVLAALFMEKFGPLMPVRVNGAPRAAIVPPIIRAPKPVPPLPRPQAAPAPVTVWNGPPILGEINDPAQLRAADFVLDYPASKYSHAMAGLVRHGREAREVMSISPMPQTELPQHNRPKAIPVQ